MLLDHTRGAANCLLSAKQNHPTALLDPLDGESLVASRWGTDVISTIAALRCNLRRNCWTGTL